jgi:hypothetical protein
MSLDVTDTLTANGVDLSELVWNVEDLSGILKAPRRRGDDLDVPGRHGKLFTPFKLYDSTDYVLNMWVIGADPLTGQVPDRFDDASQVLLDNLDALMAIFGQDTVTLDYTRPDGQTRRAVCQVSDVIEPNRILGGPITAKFSVALTNHAAFWVETRPVTSFWTQPDNTQVFVGEFASITAPCDELTIEFVGPVNNPELSQLSTGIYLAYDDVIPAGRKLAIHTDTWRLDSGTGTPWTPDYSKLRHGGAPSGRWFQIYPQAGTAPMLLWTHTTGSPATCSVSGHRKFLTA